MKRKASVAPCLDVGGNSQQPLYEELNKKAKLGNEEADPWPGPALPPMPGVTSQTRAHVLETLKHAGPWPDASSPSSSSSQYNQSAARQPSSYTSQPPPPTSGTPAGAAAVVVSGAGQDVSMEQQMSLDEPLPLAAEQQLPVLEQQPSAQLDQQMSLEQELLPLDQLQLQQQQQQVDPAAAVSLALDQLGQPILAETGRKPLVLECALADGSHYVCHVCGGVVPYSRQLQHDQYWCQRLEGGEQQDMSQ